jgi:hypothetical protein
MQKREIETMLTSLIEVIYGTAAFLVVAKYDTYMTVNFYDVPF